MDQIRSWDLLGQCTRICSEAPTHTKLTTSGKTVPNTRPACLGLSALSIYKIPASFLLISFFYISHLPSLLLGILHPASFSLKLNVMCVTRPDVIRRDVNVNGIIKPWTWTSGKSLQTHTYTYTRRPFISPLFGRSGENAFFSPSSKVHYRRYRWSTSFILIPREEILVTVDGAVKESTLRR